MDELRNLSLTRKRNETIEFFLGDRLVARVTVDELRSGRVRLSCASPRDVRILRGELSRHLHGGVADDRELEPRSPIRSTLEALKARATAAGQAARPV